MTKPKKLARTTIYENPWVNLYVDRVQFPDGRIIEKHHLLDFGRQSVAALVENLRSELLFVHAYRYTVDTIEWELPAGGIDKNESILEAAKREVYEETGYETSGHALLYTYNPMIGIANQTSHIVRCQATKKTGSFDKNEVKEFKWLSRAEVELMVREKQIKDGHTLSALLLHFSSMV